MVEYIYSNYPFRCSTKHIKGSPIATSRIGVHIATHIRLVLIRLLLLVLLVDLLLWLVILLLLLDRWLLLLLVWHACHVLVLLLRRSSHHASIRVHSSLVLLLLVHHHHLLHHHLLLKLLLHHCLLVLRIHVGSIETSKIRNKPITQSMGTVDLLWLLLDYFLSGVLRRHLLLRRIHSEDISSLSWLDNVLSVHVLRDFSNAKHILNLLLLLLLLWWSIELYLVLLEEI